MGGEDCLRGSSARDSFVKLEGFFRISLGLHFQINGVGSNVFACKISFSCSSKMDEGFLPGQANIFITEGQKRLE